MPEFRPASALVMVAGLVVSALVAAAPAPPAAGRIEAAKRRYAVAAIGDSLTDPRSGGGKYLRELARRCPQSRFDAHGVGGQQTSHMRWRFAHDVLGRYNRRPPPRYTHVIVLGGINDLLVSGVRHAPIGHIQRNLAHMYRAAKQHELSVVALTVPPWGRLAGVDDARAGATDALNRWIVASAEQGSIDHAVDIRGALSCGDDRALCPKLRRFPNDLVHWNEAGHRAVADVLQRQVFADCQ